MSAPAEMAARCLLRAGVFPADPLDMLRRSRGVWLATDRELAGTEGFAGLPPEEDARLYRYRTKDGRQMYGVCYREGAGESRLRFSLAHELGHIALRHLGEMRGVSAETRRREEDEAQAFAAALLTPAPLLALLRERFGSSPDLTAAVFGVSRSMAALALLREAEAPGGELAGRLIAAFGAQVTERGRRASKSLENGTR